jgi:hypothetical protein
LLAAALTAPIVAQEREFGGYQPVGPVPEAPMPRAKPAGDFFFLNSLEYVVDCLPAAKTHETAQQPCCGADCCRKPMPQPVPPGGLFYFGSGTIEFNERNFTLRPAPPHLLMAPPVPPCLMPAGTVGGVGSRPLSAAPMTFGPIPMALDSVQYLETVKQCAPGIFALAPTPTPANGIVVIECLADACATGHAQNPLLGTWYRDMGMGVIAVTFTPGEMKLCVSQRDDAKLVTLTATAHYTVTKDGLVYGAVTGADVDVKCEGKAGAGIGMEQAELSLMLQELADQPFSFRAKMTSAGMMVSQLKAAPLDGADGKGCMILGGLYKCAKDGRVPEPKAVDTKGGYLPGTTTVPAKPAGTSYGPPVPTDAVPPIMPSWPPVMSEPIQRVGVDFNFNPPMGLPPCPAPVVPACNEPMKSMAADAFNQMMRAAGGPVPGGMTLPSPRYLEHYPQYFAPDPAFPLPRELACQEDPEGAARRAGGATCAVPVAAGAPVKPGIIGTWYREIGSKRCVVKLAADHFTVTVSEAQEEDGETTIAHLTLTADYHITRDGLTAVGLLTSVDMKLEGDLRDGDAEAVMKQIGELQKALEDKPFAMTLRVYGDVLVIGNVRMPTVGERMEAEPAVYVGGRYKALGDKMLPKLKAVKVTEPKGPPVYGPPVPVGPGLPGVYGVPVPLPPGLAIPYNGPAFGPGVYGPPVPVPPGAFGQPTAVPGLVCPPPPAYPAPAPASDLLPPQGVPARPVSSTTPAPAPRATEESDPAPSMTPPTLPVPQMPEPAEPGVLIHVSPLGPIGLALDYAVPLNNGPNDHKQLFNFSVGVFGDPQMSEPVKPEPAVPQMPQPVKPELPVPQMPQPMEPGNEWRRFWFNDQPQHLTPERVRGGIY